MIIRPALSSGPDQCAWLPAPSVEWDPAPRVQPNALPLEQDPLHQLPAQRCAGTDPSSGVNHTVPWHDGTGGQSMEGIANLAGVSGEAGERRDLSICRHPAPGNPPDHAINQLIAHQSEESGAPLHAGGQQDKAGHDRNAAGPGWNGLLRFHGSLYVAHLENLVSVRIAHASEYHEGTENEKDNPDECLRSHDRLQSLKVTDTEISRGALF